MFDNSLILSTASFRKSVAGAVDSASSPFSALGISSDSFTYENMKSGWEAVVRETAEVIHYRCLMNLFD